MYFNVNVNRKFIVSFQKDWEGLLLLKCHQPFHSTVLQNILLCCFRLKNNIEGEWLKSSLCFINLTIAIVCNWNLWLLILTDPYLSLSRELDDALVIVPLLLAADGPHPDHHIDVVPVQVWGRALNIQIMLIVFCTSLNSIDWPLHWAGSRWEIHWWTWFLHFLDWN